MDNVNRVVNLLKVYALVTTLMIVVLVGYIMFFGNAANHFGEISVERINIVEQDGTTKLVISNSKRLPDAIIGGETLPRNVKTPGILVYNEIGEEVGGWVFSAKEVDGQVQAFSSLTFDQYQQDQTLQLVYSDESDYRLVGMRIKDRPEIPAGEHSRRLNEVLAMPEGAERDALLEPLLAPDRVFVGKSGKSSGLWLFDAHGKARIKLMVNGDGQPKLEFLDAQGNVIGRLPEATPPK